MKRGVLLAVTLFAGFFLVLSPVAPAVEAMVGKPAEDFTLPDSTGKTHSLSDYKGKIVVLEWLNHGCPFVKKHYNSGNMQKLQKMYAEKGIVWFSIVSSAPGKQGYMTPEEAVTLYLEWGNNWSHGKHLVRSKKDISYYFVINTWDDPPKIYLVKRNSEESVELAIIDIPEFLKIPFLEEFPAASLLSC